MSWSRSKRKGSIKKSWHWLAKNRLLTPLLTEQLPLLLLSEEDILRRHEKEQPICL